MQALAVRARAFRVDSGTKILFQILALYFVLISGVVILIGVLDIFYARPLSNIYAFSVDARYQVKLPEARIYRFSDCGAFRVINSETGRVYPSQLSEDIPIESECVIYHEIPETPLQPGTYFFSSEVPINRIWPMPQGILMKSTDGLEGRDTIQLRSEQRGSRWLFLGTAGLVFFAILSGLLVLSDFFGRYLRE